MAIVRVLRRTDAPNLFFGWNADLAGEPNMAEAWLDSETKELFDEKPKPKPKAKPKAKPAPVEVAEDEMPPPVDDTPVPPVRPKLPGRK